ncbi:putative tRNA pseudouridine synthase Pus10 [Porphyridium purpureum]|uniref:tRNA pseudouridine(55) synthase n=1 Tax=Porphyridium purpureum TaxID=35688 RepID=A0A5J4YM70_PORPP|nr:putative tRNA pseudouridine synthase Pus10 [Porphyridium purpureum]|eukprot:POR9388..scf249_10
MASRMAGDVARIIAIQFGVCVELGVCAQCALRFVPVEAVARLGLRLDAADDETQAESIDSQDLLQSWIHKLQQKQLELDGALRYGRPMNGWWVRVGHLVRSFFWGSATAGADSELRVSSSDLGEPANIRRAPCVVCFGLLSKKFARGVAEQAAELMREEQWQLPESGGVELHLSLPASSFLREHAVVSCMQARLKERGMTSTALANLYARLPVVAKALLAPFLERKLNVCIVQATSSSPVGRAASAVSVQISLTHQETSHEFAFVVDDVCDADEDSHRQLTKSARNSHGAQGPKKKIIGATYNRAEDEFRLSRKNLQEACRKLLSVKLDALDAIGNVHDEMESWVWFESESVFLTGRYNKYSRRVSQTPWFTDDTEGGDLLLQDSDAKGDPTDQTATELTKKRRLSASGEAKLLHEEQATPAASSSVESFIVPILKGMYGAEQGVFSASGREDRDVRMLGDGRPFCVELKGCRNLDETFDLQLLMEQINMQARGVVVVSQLARVSAATVKQTRHAEHEKMYRCVVYLSNTPSAQQLSALHDAKPLILSQRTPVRVMHRRAVMTRQRSIMSMSARLVSPRCLILDLRAQSGTYIKEFIDGDFGRTRPNLGELLQCQASILQLDVLNVL